MQFYVKSGLNAIIILTDCLAVNLTNASFVFLYEIVISHNITMYCFTCVFFLIPLIGYTVGGKFCQNCFVPF